MIFRQGADQSRSLEAADAFHHTCATCEYQRDSGPIARPAFLRRPPSACTACARGAASSPPPRRRTLVRPLGHARRATRQRSRDAPAGTWVRKPRLQWHTFWNAGETQCEIIEIISPAGFENYFREVAATWGDEAKLAAINQKYTFEIQLDSVPELCRRFGLTFPALFDRLEVPHFRGRSQSRDGARAGCCPTPDAASGARTESRSPPDAMSAATATRRRRRRARPQRARGISAQSPWSVNTTVALCTQPGCRLTSGKPCASQSISDLHTDVSSHPRTA